MVHASNKWNPEQASAYLKWTSSQKAVRNAASAHSWPVFIRNVSLESSLLHFCVFSWYLKT